MVQYIQRNVYAYQKARIELALSFILLSHPPQALLPPSKHMHNNINHDTESQHARDNSKAHEILWLVVCREEIRSIDLCQVAHSVDERQCDTPDIGIHGAECSACERQRDGVGSPQAGGHEDEEDVAGGEVVDGADEDGGDEGEGEPGGDDDTAVLGDAVGEVAGYGGANEGDGVDGDGHVLGLDGGGVAETVDERGVEVGEGGRPNDDLGAC